MGTARPVCVAVIPSKVPNDITGLAARRLNQLLELAVSPAVSAAGMELVHLDPTIAGTLTERQLLDNLLFCDASIFDASDSVPEVCYLLGVRLALKAESTILLQREGTSCDAYPALPRPLLYQCQAMIEEQTAKQLVELLSRRLSIAQSAPARAEMEYYHLLSEYRAVEISRTKTDRFRAAVRYRQDLKTRLADARALSLPESLSALRRIERELQPTYSVDSAVLVDLFLSYRAEGSWEDICRFYEDLPLALRRAVMIREQYALALNRLGKREMALTVLREIEAVQGPSSETCSLIGRVYKDLWQDCERTDNLIGAQQFLRAAIDAYHRGFKADWRDAYPGINLVTLLDIEGSMASLEERDKFLPIVHFAAEHRVGLDNQDYWDHATLLELAILEYDRQAANRILGEAIERAAESWQLGTTVNNLKLLQRYRGRKEDVGWIHLIIASLEAAAKTLAGGNGRVINFS